jgi:23S rRNA pseudouridine955/2504/2580 synthase
MSNIIKIKEEYDGQRLDRFMKKEFPGLTYGQSQKLIRTGQIRLNGKRCKADTILNAEQELRLPPSLAAGAGKSTSQNKARPISDGDKAYIRQMVIYEDTNLVALNKPHGLAVQGGSKTTRHIDGLLPALKASSKEQTPKLLHRIDKDTSGLLLCGKTTGYTKHVTNAFKQKHLQKIYVALCSPAPRENYGTVQAPLSKQNIKGLNQERMIVDAEEGQKAVTHYEVLDRIGNDAALIKFTPVTGRTHQIRVHAEFMGSPIVGDNKYNSFFPVDHNCREEDFNAQRESVKELCKNNCLNLHALAALIPASSTTKEKLLSAPISNEIKSNLKALGLTFPPLDEVIDFTK